MIQARTFIFILALLSLLSLAPRTAHAADPYADSYNEKKHEVYLTGRRIALDYIKYIYFAIGCGALQNEAFALPLVHGIGTNLQNSGLRDQILDYDLDDMMRKAALDGLAKSKRPNACIYWRDNPDEVYRLREDAQATSGGNMVPPTLP